MSAAPIPWKHIRNTLVLFAPLWGGAILLFGALGAVTAMFGGEMWSARQPLVIRDEATGATERLGRFASETERKAAQETILELAQNPEVVRAALKQLGPGESKSAENWPTIATVENVAEEQINVIAPQGSEFGGSELIYLQCQDRTPERAKALCRAVMDNLTAHLRQVRRIRADSVMAELTHARDLARQKLDSAVARMQDIEVEFGSDLGELRNLNDTISGDGTNRKTMQETREQLKQAKTDLEKLESLHQLLVTGSEDPQRLVVSGSELLTSQPSLQRLKEGLIDAQIDASELAGIYTAEHPKRRAAMHTEEEIRDRMVQEARLAARSMQPSLKLARGRVGRLDQENSVLEDKLGRLAKVRAGYSKLDSQVDALTEELADAEAALSDAQASRTAALSTSLLAELGPPQTGDKPLGVSGLTLTVGSTLAGLIFGLGSVFLIAPGPTGASYGRRWSDYLGRRSTDRPADGSNPSVPCQSASDGRGRRASDRLTAQANHLRRGSDPAT